MKRAFLEPTNVSSNVLPHTINDSRGCDKSFPSVVNVERVESTSRCAACFEPGVDDDSEEDDFEFFAALEAVNCRHAETLKALSE